MTPQGHGQSNFSGAAGFLLEGTRRGAGVNDMILLKKSAWELIFLE